MSLAEDLIGSHWTPEWNDHVVQRVSQVRILADGSVQVKSQGSWLSVAFDSENQPHITGWRQRQPLPPLTWEDALAYEASRIQVLRDGCQDWCVRGDLDDCFRQMLSASDDARNAP